MTYVAKGYLDASDDVAFTHIRDAAKCFGKASVQSQSGGFRHPREAGKLVWFPKLYANSTWRNRISDDEDTIWEIHESTEAARKHIDRELKSGLPIRVVFARVRSPLGDVMYRFKGEYELDGSSTNYCDGLVWRRIGKLVNTYSIREGHD